MHPYFTTFFWHPVYIFLFSRKVTHEVTIRKKFKSFNSVPLPDGLAASLGCSSPITTSHTCDTNPSDYHLHDIIPSLTRHQILHTPASQLVSQLYEDSPSPERQDLPPSYSLIDFQEPPQYDELSNQNKFSSEDK